MWFRKEKLDSKEYLKLLHKFAELSTEVEILMSNVNLLKNRKWKKKEPEPETKELKTSDGLDTLRGLENV